MNKKGFTLVELLATLIILGIVVGITLVSMSGVLGNAKEKSEETLINTVVDAIEIYLDSDGKSARYDMNTAACTINKTHKDNVKIYSATKDSKGDDITFKTIINSSYRPIEASDLVNPANKEQCSIDAKVITLYKDEDQVYYYKIKKQALNCWLKPKDENDVITNLPCECLSSEEKSFVNRCN